MCSRQSYIYGCRHDPQPSSVSGQDRVLGCSTHSAHSLLQRGRGSSLRLSAPSEMLMSRDSTAPRCWMVGAMLAVCAGLVCLGAALGSWARRVRPLASFDVPLLSEQGPVNLEVQGQGLQKRLSSPSLSPRSQVFANPAADARSCQQQTGEE